MKTQDQRFNSSLIRRCFRSFACGPFFICLFGLFSAAATGAVAATQDDVSSSLTYYVDGLKGDDQNTGTAPEESWRSVDRANRADFDPDDPKNLSNHSSNGIVAGGVEGGLIEYCEAFNNGWDMPHKGVTLR